LPLTEERRRAHAGDGMGKRKRVGRSKALASEVEWRREIIRGMERKKSSPFQKVR